MLSKNETQKKRPWSTYALVGAISLSSLSYLTNKMWIRYILAAVSVTLLILGFIVLKKSISKTKE